MIAKGYIRVVALFICFGTIFSGLNACIIMFINDSNGIIRINNKNDGTSFDLKKNGRPRRFGSPDMPSYFEVLVPQPKTKFFRLLYTCKQNECGKNGNPQIKFSELDSDQGAATLFTIIKNETPYTSMVSGLPMIQKKVCHSCNDKRE